MSGWRSACAVLLLLGPIARGPADVPVRTEQVIYSIIAYNGRDYSATFAPQASDTIYLIADNDSFLSLRTTFVYWWPPTGLWQTETSTFNEFQPGTLEVRDARGAVRRLSLERYTVFNVGGDYEQNWKVAVGDAALKEYQHSRDIAEAYLRATDLYQARHDEYLARLRALSTRIEELKAKGGDWSGLKRTMDTLPAPSPPEEPRDYVVPPSPVQWAFIVRLPPGRYRARLLDSEGAVLEGSEKTIVTHAQRRSGGVGYEVIPGDKWTRPEESKTPSSVLYVNGKADLYLAVFSENEYNELQYGKTIDNAAHGNPHVFQWTRIQQVPRSTLRLRGLPGGEKVLREQAFLVEQTGGASLGYTIVPFDGQGDQEGKQANLIAFHVPLSSGGRTFTLAALDGAGKLLGGSEREIRIMAPPASAFPFVLMAMVPLLAMAGVLIARARFYGKTQTDRDD